MTISFRSGAIFGLVLGLAVAGCASPSPPRPAMQPLAVAGNFGFTDRAIDDDTIEVVYRGAEITVSNRNARNDTRLEAEKLKVRDLALLHGAKMARDRGATAIRVATERVDSDTDVRSQPRCRPSPFWGPPGYWGYGYRPHHYGYGYGAYGWPGPYYDCHESRWAKGRATAVLTLDMVPAGTEGSEEVAALIARLEQIYAQATYP